MIMKNGIKYGEANDPTTVLSEEEVPVGCMVVGAGNRGIKPFKPGNKMIVVTDKYGNASSLSYDVSNMVVGTNESGELVMRELPHQYTFVQFGGQNKATKLNTNSDGVTYSIADSDINCKLVVNKTTAGATRYIATFDVPLTLLTATECIIAASAGFDFPIKNLKLLDNYDNAIELNTTDVGYALSATRTMTLPKGTYKRLEITEAETVEAFTEKTLYLNCLICY